MYSLPGFVVTSDRPTHANVIEHKYKIAEKRSISFVDIFFAVAVCLLATKFTKKKDDRSLTDWMRNTRWLCPLYSFNSASFLNYLLYRNRIAANFMFSNCQPSEIERCMHTHQKRHVYMHELEHVRTHLSYNEHNKKIGTNTERNGRNTISDIHKYLLFIFCGRK